jgi:hypothetical protein
MSKVALRVIAVAGVIALLGVGSYAIAGSGTNSFKGDPMLGYAENLDVSTTGNGSFEAKLTPDYTLSYAGMEGNVLQAHVHFGKTAVNGGISFFLCTNLNVPTDDDCPQSGTVEGDIEAADVIGPVAQGIEVGNLAEIVAAMRAGHAYANVHTSKWPGGEIRAQLNDHGERGD